MNVVIRCAGRGLIRMIRSVINVRNILDYNHIIGVHCGVSSHLAIIGIVWKIYLLETVVRVRSVEKFYGEKGSGNKFLMTLWWKKKIIFVKSSER